MEVRLLGPVELTTLGRAVQVGPPQRRGVLAALAVDARRPVTIEALIDRIWGEQPPDGARRTVHAHIARLRNVLTQIREDNTPTLVRRSGGYVLDVDRDAVDLHRFRRLIDDARDPTCPDVQRLVLLREALGLWRGSEPLAGVAGQWAVRTREAWRQQHVDGVLMWAAVELRGGNPAVVIGPLTDLVGEQPLVEPLVAMLIRALCAAGYTQRALDRYAAARQSLHDELGIEPNNELRSLHQRILRNDANEIPPTIAPQLGCVSVPPAQLPPAANPFAGRDAERALLNCAMSGRSERSNGVAVCMLSGSAGVGKTALAVRWAHEVRSEFPDGQLYVDLRGYDPEQPLAPGDVLARFLRSLGTAEHDIPLDTDERASAFRSILDRRRMLVLLDNASSVEQVRPLLPGSPLCFAVITSRDSLAGLVARHGAYRVGLGLLPQIDAVALLHRLIGARVTDELHAAGLLAAQCAYLPLALRIAAELVTARPELKLSTLVGELADEQRRLDLLDASGDPHTAVRTAFSWSYEKLTAPAARMFRMLGLHPGPSVDPHAGAALTNTTTAQAKDALDQLTRAHLIESTGSDRYGMHDLLRAYARDLSATVLPQADRQAALTQLFDYYVAAVTTAKDKLYTTEHGQLGIDRSATPLPPLDDPAAATAWLDAERHTMVAVVAHTATHGFGNHTHELADNLFSYLSREGHLTDAMTIYGHALASGRRTGDPLAQADALAHLGFVHFRQGRYEHEAECMKQALALYHQIGNLTGEASALRGLATAHFRQGHYQQTIEHLQAALALYNDAGDTLGKASVMDNLGIVHERLGHYSDAIEYLQDALAQYREIGHSPGIIRILGNLGGLPWPHSQSQQFTGQPALALKLAREIGDRFGEANTLHNLGNVYYRQGSYEEAAEHHRQALTLFREKVGDRAREAEVLNGLGDALRAHGLTREAHAQYAAALTLATHIKEPYQQAQAHDGIAHSHRATGDPESARHHWEAALELYAAMEVPDAAAVRTNLARTYPRQADRHDDSRR